MYRLLVFMLILAMAIPVTADAQRPPKKKKNKKEVVLKENERIKLERNFIEAVKAKMIGDYQNAISLFNECLRIDVSNTASKYELADIYLRTGQNQPALLFAAQAANEEPSNKWYLELNAQALAANGRFKAAAQIYGRLIKLHPTNVDYYFDQAFMLENDDEPSEALKVYDKIEGLVGINEMVTLHKRIIYMRQGKLEKAVEEVQKLIKEFPREAKYYGILGEMYQSKRMDEKALESFNKMLEIDPGNPKALMAIASQYKKNGDEKKYIETIEAVFENRNYDIDKKVAILFSYFEYFMPERPDNEKKNEAYSLADILVKTHPDEAAGHAIYGDFLFQDDSLFEARKHYQQSIGLDNNKYSVWKNLMLIDAEVQEFDSLLAHSNAALSIFPNQTLVHYFNGAANMRLEKYPDAIKSFETALVIGTDNKQLKADIYSNCGDAYHELEQHAKSDSCYDEALNYDPANEYVLNNYSYYLSLRADKLDKAEKMSQRANMIHPNNAAFQDTYAWILYKQKRYLEAKEWMGNALKNGGEDRPVILEHYGDVLFRLGEIDEAVEYWKKAKEKGSESEDIDQKIQEKKIND